MKRNEFLALLEAALTVGEAGFAREAADAWLALWPGDLTVQLIRAKISHIEGDLENALERLRAIVQRDPEWLEAWELVRRVEPPGVRRLSSSADPSASLRTGGGDFGLLGGRGDLIELARSCIAALATTREQVAGQPEWVILTRRGRLAMLNGDLRLAGEALGEAVATGPPTPLPWVLHFRLARHSGGLKAAIALGEAYLAQWPNCVALQLGLADLLNKAGPPDHGTDTGGAARAAALLHTAAAADLAGQVARRIWPTGNPYAGLWLNEMLAVLPRPIPAKVAALLGQNRIGEGEPQQPKEVHGSLRGAPSAAPSLRSGPWLRASLDRLGRMRFSRRILAPQPGAPNQSAGGDTTAPASVAGVRPVQPLRGDGSGKPPEASRTAEASQTSPQAEREALREIHIELEKVARRVSRKKTPALRPVGDEDTRTAAYIVLASQKRLSQKYGEEAAGSVLGLAESLAQRVASRPAWRGYAVVVDSADSLTPFGLRPVDPTNAWEIKLLLRDLDAALATRGEMIGALLLIGGHDLLPFHLLPNPTDDADEEVPSDNPYATRDENYFVPEWAVGRLPASEGNDPTILLRQLREAITNHSSEPREKSLLRHLPALLNWLREFVRWRSPASGEEPGFGYSANIWKDASLAVFSMIGEPRDLLTSPPVDAVRLPVISPTLRKLSYFNLHGIEDGPDWYGQGDPEIPPSSQPEYPIAFRPADVVNSGRAPQIVFTEACYGANISGKKVEEALSLKFLDSGTRVVVGSTKIAYGSITTPLIGADLLGKLFWEYLAEELAAGEALRRAKISFARILDRRQGYLDGEDQKTLISFVYYGDPLLPPLTAFRGRNKRVKKGVYRNKTHAAGAPIACARLAEGRDEGPADPEVMAHVKSIVARYLPGMQGAAYTITHPHTACSAHDHDCPTAHLSLAGAKGTGRDAERNVVVTLSKVIQVRHHAHPAFARLTMDVEGKVLKLAVSR